MTRQIHIENQRLILHKLKVDDLNVLASMRKDLRIYRYEPAFLIERQGTPEEALNTIQNMDLYKERQCLLGIYEKEDPNTLVGLAELYDFKTSGKVISLGYRLIPRYWGNGIASSCVSALLGFIRNETEVEMVTAHVIPDNKGSSKCLLKNGFELLLAKSEDWGYDKPVEAEVYTLDIEH